MVVGYSTDDVMFFMRDKSSDGIVYTLNADRSVTRWRGPRVEAQALYLEGSDAEVSNWLTYARNEHLYLSLATGHHLYFDIRELKQRANAYVGIVWWEDSLENIARAYKYDAENGTNYAGLTFYGPLMDLGVAFLRGRDRDRVWQASCEREAELARALDANVHAELVALEDERVFNDIEATQ